MINLVGLKIYTDFLTIHLRYYLNEMVRVLKMDNKISEYLGKHEHTICFLLKYFIKDLQTFMYKNISDEEIKRIYSDKSDASRT
jgi:hypothetical protein